MSDSATAPQQHAPAWRAWLLRVFVALALAGGLMLYLRPGFVMDMATRWMLC
jgi:hypothetical protein